MTSLDALAKEIEAAEISFPPLKFWEHVFPDLQAGGRVYLHEDTEEEADSAFLFALEKLREEFQSADWRDPFGGGSVRALRLRSGGILRVATGAEFLRSGATLCGRIGKLDFSALAKPLQSVPALEMREDALFAPRDPLKDGNSVLKLVASMGDDASVVRAARVSLNRDSNEEGKERLLNFLARNRHGSPFEHTALTFLVKAPLFVIAQWQRHRAGWGYNQLSRRYSSEDIEFYLPRVWRKQAETNKQASAGEFADDKNYWFAEKLSDICEDAESKYKFLLEQGVAREMARMILPQNLYTRMYATCNLRSLDHFIGLRATSEAQLEIRAYAEGMREIAEQIFPLSMRALEKARTKNT